jgi:hypothetical protein
MLLKLRPSKQLLTKNLLLIVKIDLHIQVEVIYQRIWLFIESWITSNSPRKEKDALF